MKKSLLIVLAGLIVVSGGYGVYRLVSRQAFHGDSFPVLPPNQPVDFTASFEIYTLGTKRIFTAAMYHNLSPDVYITADNPAVIHVKKSGVTWQDFFATLPMSLTPDCLITGTKQTFCTNERNKLKFYLNEVEVPDALGLPIGPGGKLKVVYE